MDSNDTTDDIGWNFMHQTNEKNVPDETIKSPYMIQNLKMPMMKSILKQLIALSFL